MDGTSMASPVATATLAALLAADPRYRELPHAVQRATYAFGAARSRAFALGSNAHYQGAGLVRG